MNKSLHFSLVDSGVRKENDLAVERFLFLWQWRNGSFSKWI